MTTEPLETVANSGRPLETAANSGLGWRRAIREGGGRWLVMMEGLWRRWPASNGREPLETVVGDDKGPPNMIN